MNAAYITDLGTYAQRAELVGTLYHMDTTQSPPKLHALGEQITITESDLQSVDAADLTSSRITGASVDLIDLGKVVASDLSLEFQGKIVAEDAAVRRVSKSRASKLIQEHYSGLRSDLVNDLGREPTFAELPMDLPRIADQEGQYYVLVTGGDHAKKLNISFGPPDESTNGFSINVNGKNVSGVQIRGQTTKNCSQSENRETPARCSVSIEAFSATLKTPLSKLRVRPATLSTKVIADAFRGKG